MYLFAIIILNFLSGNKISTYLFNLFLHQINLKNRVTVLTQM